MENLEISLLGNMPSVAAVQALSEHMRHLPQVDCQTTHMVHGGMYARTIFIPAGTVLTGTKTNIENICIVSGDITVTTDEGLKRLVGFTVIPANAGFKRAGFAHADTHWTTLLQTDLTDVEEIENMFTDDSHELQTRTLGLKHNDIEAHHGIC